jgi:transposase
MRTTSLITLAFFQQFPDDETFVGGVEKGQCKRENKAVVFGMMERGGEIVTEVVPDRKRTTLLPLIEENVKQHSIVHTDKHTAYLTPGRYGYYHDTVNHNQGQYVSATGLTFNSIEGFWRHMKSSINGAHIWISPKRLGKYAKEFENGCNPRNQHHSM